VHRLTSDFRNDHAVLLGGGAVTAGQASRHPEPIYFMSNIATAIVSTTVLAGESSTASRPRASTRTRSHMRASSSPSDEGDYDRGVLRCPQESPMDSDSSSNIDTLSRFVEQYHLRRHSEPSADQNVLLVFRQRAPLWVDRGH
jgi:hypothetical protein